MLAGVRSFADLYHVKCFEKIADLSRVEFLDRLQILTRSNYRFRGLSAKNVISGNYLLDGGAERLLLNWKAQRGRWIDKNAGEQPEPDISTAFSNLLRNSGSSSFTYEKVEGLGMHEYMLLTTMLAPFESDGPQDTDEWNLFTEYLPGDEDEDQLHEQHSLSSTLARWNNDVVRVIPKYSDGSPSWVWFACPYNFEQVHQMLALCTTAARYMGRGESD
ncbi:hypothetical protein LTR84_007411 [Exophiala bonariae]|uniref:Uncharacterized protein n=1 Tax=Exophiala bonariae TaxID=1690606 RepID=A0AAV9MYF5_9EURO|nr:hypothetical protein LTR84_007411 [Exophiala bonariae]